MWNRIRSLAAAFGFALSFAANSQAAVIINIQEVGPNVVMSTTGGTLNLTTFTSFVNSNDSGQIAANGLALGEGSFEGFVGDFSSFSFYSTLGTVVYADIHTGEPVGFGDYAATGQDTIAVPAGSVINNIATINAASSTFLNQSYATLGLSPGTYVNFWGVGTGNQDFFIVNIQASSNPVPEPSSAAIGLLLAGSAGLVRKIRKQRS